MGPYNSTIIEESLHANTNDMKYSISFAADPAHNKQQLPTWGTILQLNMAIFKHFCFNKQSLICQVNVL